MNTYIHKNTIDRLSSLIDHLMAQAKRTDNYNSELKSHRLIENNNLFSQSLFSTQSDQISSYVEEIKTQLASFKRLYTTSDSNNNKQELAKSSLLQIEQQISAVFNALQANQSMHESAQMSYDHKIKSRKQAFKKQQSQKEYDKYNKLTKGVLVSSHELYQKLNEHHEFERRLVDMIAEREQQRSRARSTNNNVSEEILALHQRLGRCRKAITSIERDIELSEKGNIRQ